MNALAAFLASALLSAIVPVTSWINFESQPECSCSSLDEWPAELLPAEARLEPRSPREERFARDFPGRIGVFALADGGTLVLRRVEQPTRQLHPAADCLRALGFAIEPGPIHAARDGTEWSTLTATRGGERLRVRERMLGADGRRWTDLSAWFWAAAFGRSAGPWWAVTEIEVGRDD